MEFQIEQSYGKDGKAYLYFTTVGVKPQLDLLERMAISKCKKDWERINEFPKFIGSHTPFRPTVIVREYNNGVVKNGISFKCKWR